jgi:hypothetical protein
MVEEQSPARFNELMIRAQREAETRYAMYAALAENPTKEAAPAAER